MRIYGGLAGLKVNYGSFGAEGNLPLLPPPPHHWSYDVEMNDDISSDRESNAWIKSY